MKAVIIGNGSAPPPKTFAREVQSSDLLIAADGGANYCLRNSFHPHAVIGDMDSIEDAFLESLKKSTSIYQYPADKDLTDLELAYLHAEKEKVDDLKVFSWADERIDYTLGALIGLRDAKMPVQFFGHSFEIFVLNKARPRLTISARVGATKVSIGSLSSRITLRSTGLKWELQWESIATPQLSLSNRAESAAQIDLTEGSAFVLLERAFD